MNIAVGNGFSGTVIRGAASSASELTEGEARQFEPYRPNAYHDGADAPGGACPGIGDKIRSRSSQAVWDTGKPHHKGTTTQHAEPLTAIFGRQALRHLRRCWPGRVQRQRGVGQSTVRRVSILRAAYGWAVRASAAFHSVGIAAHVPSPRIAPSSRGASAVRRGGPRPAGHRARHGDRGAHRPKQLFRLRWSDVDVGTGVIRMPNAHKGAGEESRDVPIRDDVLGLLRRWHEEDRQTGCAYVIAYKGRPVRSISSGWHNALRRAGIARRIRPYDLRHAFASLALVYGADIKCVAETMGHKNITMLLSVYQHTLFEQRRRAVNAAPGLFSGTGAKRGRKTPPARQGGGQRVLRTGPGTPGGASARRGGLMGRCRLRLRWNPRGGQDGCRDSGRTAAGRKRGG
ncbi:MAG: tyrosine-type recombinase/integrase [Bilophila wadsworthia]